MSVIGQGYPNLEYLIIDGGSTDDSVNILKKYDKHIAYWVSEKDQGQSDAINKGFRRATGDILGWLNSDDLYLPGTLLYLASQIKPGLPQVVFGNCFHFIENSPSSWGSDVTKWGKTYDLRLFNYVIQPSSFWTREAWSQTGDLDSSLHYVFDWDWFIRAQQSSVAFTAVNRYLALFRFHSTHKSSAGGDKRSQEIASLYKKYAGEKYVAAFHRLCERKSRLDNFEKWIHKFRLGRLKTRLFRAAYPDIFREIDEMETQSLRLMLPPPPV